MADERAIRHLQQDDDNLRIVGRRRPISVPLRFCRSVFLGTLAVAIAR